MHTHKCKNINTRAHIHLDTQMDVYMNLIALQRHPGNTYERATSSKLTPREYTRPEKVVPTGGICRFRHLIPRTQASISAAPPQLFARERKPQDHRVVNPKTRTLTFLHGCPVKCQGYPLLWRGQRRTGSTGGPCPHGAPSSLTSQSRGFCSECNSPRVQLVLRHGAPEREKGVPKFLLLGQALQALKDSKVSQSRFLKPHSSGGKVGADAVGRSGRDQSPLLQP